MSQNFVKTKPCLLEAGLPCASLSAECQRDNNARQRPPQNRLHIWWARRPPTISRAAILAALLPYELDIEDAVLPEWIDEPSEKDIEKLPRKLEAYRPFFKQLLEAVKPSCLISSHQKFLLSLGVIGDADAAYRRMLFRNLHSQPGEKIPLPDSLVYRHQPAIRVSPSVQLINSILGEIRQLLRIDHDEPVVVLDSMAGGGVIPIESVRYGTKVYANDLNPVAGLILKATIEYPSRFGRNLGKRIAHYSEKVDDIVRGRLSPAFSVESQETWWSKIDASQIEKLRTKQVISLEPGGDAITRDYLWQRIVSCSKCELNVPISTNFHIVYDKDKPEAAIAAFPEVPPRGAGNDCTFRIVKYDEWTDCHWPKPGFDHWHPRETPTFKDGKAICPRCGHVMDGDEVKRIARAREGGLPSQMYAVCSQVPVKLTYRNGEVKIRYLWRFRAPTPADLDAVKAAEEELARLLPKWEAQGLVPNEEVPEGDKTREPRNMGMTRWRDLFLPRQLLTNLVILEELRAAQARARAELPADEAEAVNVYLSFILSKVVNYNSVNTFWHYGRQTVTQTFSRHDFAFRPAFCEFEGARETVMWGASQVINAYDELARLIHGEPVVFAEDDEAADDPEAMAEDEAAEDASGDDAVQVSKPAAAVEELPHLRPEVIVPTVTNEDAAALSMPAPGTVHLICVDPPYYNNVQYAELSNFFYVWLKRALHDEPGLAHLFREPLAESNREAVANQARWQRDAERDLDLWQQNYDRVVAELRAQGLKLKVAREQALVKVGFKPPTAKDRADRFYEDKMAAVFRRARQLLHPAGRMVVMFNHKATSAWRALGMALIRAGFEIRSSVPIHTEAESSLNIRGLDAARSTVLLLCLPREEQEQPVGNWGAVQSGIVHTARQAAELFQSQGLDGTDLYLSALGPALGVVGRAWPVTDLAGREVDLNDGLEAAYRAVGQWRLAQILDELNASADFRNVAAEFSTETADRDTQTLWLWLDTFQGDTADSDDVRKLAKSLGVNPDDFKKMGLLTSHKDLFTLCPPQDLDFTVLVRRLRGETVLRGRAARQADDAWEERTFPGFVGAAVWHGIALLGGGGQEAVGIDGLRRWLYGSGYASQKEFFGAFAVTLHVMERTFGSRTDHGPWGVAVRQARRAWDLLLKNWSA